MLFRHHHLWRRTSCRCPPPAIAVVIMGHHCPSPSRASWSPTFWGHARALLSLSTANTAPRQQMRRWMLLTSRTWFDSLDRHWPYHQKIDLLLRGRPRLAIIIILARQTMWDIGSVVEVKRTIMKTTHCRFGRNEDQSGQTTIFRTYT